MDSIAGTSPRQLARIAGALYLINIVAGAFAIGSVPAMLITPDMATTVNIQTHELLYRLGLVPHIVVTLTNVPMALPTIFGEGSLCPWLLVAGVNVERWKEHSARTSTPTSPPVAGS
jgi:hypothetical protein